MQHWQRSRPDHRATGHYRQAMVKCDDGKVILDICWCRSARERISCIRCRVALCPGGADPGPLANVFGCVGTSVHTVAVADVGVL